MLLFVLSLLVLLFLALVNVMLCSLYERHVIGLCQCRYGPNKAGLGGIAQSLLDGLKLFTKEICIPVGSRMPIFLGAPVVAFVLANMYWLLVPYTYCFSHTSYSVLGFLVLVGLSSFVPYRAGVARASKYAYLGAMRAASQTVSYEVILSSLMICFCFTWGSLKFSGTAIMAIWVLLPILMIVLLAELGRCPFDFYEGEREIVRGFNLEYSGVPFALFFMSEYMNILSFSLFTAVILVGGIGTLAMWAVFFVILWTLLFIRCLLPRFRYDMLTYLCWKNLMMDVFVTLVLYFLVAII